MKTAARVKVQLKDQAPDDWRCFIAALCFIEFYTQLIWNGRCLWDLLSDDWYRRFWGEQYGFLVSSAALRCALAFAFLGFGRSLCHRYRTVARWLAAVIACSAAISIIAVLNIRVPSGSSYLWGIEINSERSPTLALSRVILFDRAEHIPWMALLICGWLTIGRKRDWGCVRRPPWVVLAAAWMFSMAFLHLLHGGWPVWSNLARLVASWTSLDIYDSVSVLHVVLPLLAGLWLLLIRTTPFLLPLLIAVLGVLSIVCSTYFWLPAVIAADGSHRFVLNRQMFDTLFVSWVAVAGPWLLIAAYAWRLPTRMPTEDGSPYPRRYCGRCYYNLHGINSAICPECGVTLYADDELA